MKKSNIKAIFTGFCLFALNNLYCKGQDTVIYENNDSAIAEANIFECLKTREPHLKGSNKRMLNIVDFVNRSIEEDMRHKNPLLFINGKMSNDDMGFPLYRMPNIIEADEMATIYQNNLHVVSYGCRVYEDGWSYHKRPVVWFLDGYYYMTTGYHGKWIIGKGDEKTTEKNGYEYSLMPTNMRYVSTVVFSSDFSLLKRWLPNCDLLYKKSPLIILVRTLPR